ncbi:hypothetical protein EYF80_023265 [Liparis tanakae]|uniref:Uncharacterized protein n=1 Tax=Liparis tanakae TaxID=230148 RepID=A0A4Z2HL13_9TELE|nr:hypothetical protein EYF80_023265 [Liparis tanakae]
MGRQDIKATAGNEVNVTLVLPNRLRMKTSASGNALVGHDKVLHNEPLPLSKVLNARPPGDRILAKQLHRYPSRASSPGSQHRPLKNNGRHVAGPLLPGGGTARCERFSSRESVPEILLHHSRRKNTVSRAAVCIDTRLHNLHAHSLSPLSLSLSHPPPSLISWTQS